MEKDGLPSYTAAVAEYPTRQRRRFRRPRALKLAVLASFIFIVYAQWSQITRPHSTPKGGSTLSLERLQADLATCAKLQHKPKDPSGPRDRNARYIDGHKPTLIKNATVWVGEPITGTTPEEAHAGKGYEWVQSDVLLQYGLITNVGVGIPEDDLPEDTSIYDAAGRQLTAGIIDMHSHAGVDPLPSLRGGEDTNELSSDITPYVRSIDGIDPLDHQIQVIKSGGVTTSLILPGSGNNMGGEAFVVKHAVGKPDGRLEISATDMLADPDRNWRYMKMACGENAKRVYGKVGEHGPTSRLGESWEFRHAFEQAREVVRSQDAWCNAAATQGVENMEIYLPQPLEWESLAAALRGQVHINTHCYTVPDLEAYIDHTNEFEFPIRAFHHAHETYLVPEILKRAWGGRPPAAALFADNMYYKAEAYRGSEQAGKILYENGITPVYVSDNPVLNAQHVVFEAAKAYRYGLPYHAALSGVTTAPAELLGLGERIGKVKAGFDADVVLWDSDPLSVGAAPIQVWIDGTAQFSDPYVLEKPAPKPIDPSNQLPETTDEPVEIEDIIFTGVSDVLVPGLDQSMNSDEASGTVIIKSGKIICTGPCHKEINTLSPSARIVHLQNGHLAPSFTLLGSTLGLSEIPAEASTNDGSNGPEVFSYAVDGLALDNKNLAAAYKHGVTKAITAPVLSSGGAGGVSAGFLTRAGTVLEKGAVWADEVAVHYKLTPSVRGGKTTSISSAVGALRSSLLKAASSNETDTDKYSEESYLKKVVSGTLPLAISVNSADTIAALLRVKEQVEAETSTPLRIVIIGGAESHVVASALAKAGVGVVLAPLLPYAESWDQRRSLTGAPLTNGTAINVLLDAGVLVAIGTSEDWQARDLGLSAGIAYANGEGRLSPTEALGLVGRNVYELLGLKSDTDTGDFVVYEGNPLEIKSTVVAIGGKSGIVSVYV